MQKRLSREDSHSEFLLKKSYRVLEVVVVVVERRGYAEDEVDFGMTLNKS